MSIDWTRGYSCRWRVFAVNPQTWADGERVEDVDSVTIERADSDLVESGTISMTSNAGGDLPRGYYRIALTAVQDGAAERIDVATLLVESTGSGYDRHVAESEAEARSVLYPASTTRMLAGSYAPAGSDGARLAADMIASAIAAPVVNEGRFTLDADVVFDLGDSVLEAARAILDAGNHTIRIDGDGTVRVAARPAEPALSLSDAGTRLLMPGTAVKFDRSSIPNRFTAVDGGEVATAVNADPASKVSTVSRGYIVDKVDESPKRVNGETLEAYAARRLAELSVAGDSVQYTREFWPGVTIGDVVRGMNPEIGIDGDMRVTSQRLTCGRGIVVEERAEKEVALWPV